MSSNILHPFPECLNNYRSSLNDTILKNWQLNRTAVNKDTDILIKYLSKKIPNHTLHESVSGEKNLTWTVPMNWEVREGYIALEDGTKIVDFKDNALHLWTHSISVDKKISLKNLLPKIKTNKNRPDEFEYVFRNGYRPHVKDWGFSVPYNKLKDLKEDQILKVFIDSTLNYNGTIKTFDTSLKGKSKKTILFMAHTCHPYIVNDGLGCIATLIELYNYLHKKKNRKYTYRFIFGPEYFGAANFLHKLSAQELSNIKFGMFLDMVGTNEPLGFQTSFQGNTFLDLALTNVLKTHVGTYLKKPYRKMWPNDEVFHNGPGINIPTLGFGRAMYREYHYNTDNYQNFNMYNAIESLWVLIRTIEILETNIVPTLNYKGPLYLSAHNLYIDPYVNPEGYDNLEYIQMLIDGKLSVFEIAEKLNIDYFFVLDFIQKLFEKSLLNKKNWELTDKDFSFGSCYGTKFESTINSLDFPWEKR